MFVDEKKWAIWMPKVIGSVAGWEVYMGRFDTPEDALDAMNRQPTKAEIAADRTLIGWPSRESMRVGRLCIAFLEPNA
jgi:hypothetical protein